MRQRGLAIDAGIADLVTSDSGAGRTSDHPSWTTRRDPSRRRHTRERAWQRPPRLLGWQRSQPRDHGVAQNARLLPDTGSHAGEYLRERECRSRPRAPRRPAHRQIRGRDSHARLCNRVILHAAASALLSAISAPAARQSERKRSWLMLVRKQPPTERAPA